MKTIRKLEVLVIGSTGHQGGAFEAWPGGRIGGPSPDRRSISKGEE